MTGVIVDCLAVLWRDLHYSPDLATAMIRPQRSAAIIANGRQDYPRFIEEVLLPMLAEKATGVAGALVDIICDREPRSGLSVQAMDCVFESLT